MRAADTVRILALAVVLGTSLARAQSAPTHAHESGAEAQLARVLGALAQGGLEAALGEADRLVARFPNFRLGHLLRGDLLLARSRPLSDLGEGVRAARERLDDLREEAEARLRAARDLPALEEVPRDLLQLAPSQESALVIDASRSRIYVYENDAGVPRLTGHYYSTLGKRGIDKRREGDQKTPIGVYHVTSRIAGSKLPDLYGWGAFPLDYPNEWDRLQRRTGYGIWIHGVPADTYARAPQASDGCIALANPEIEQLAHHVRPGATPVIIARRVEWASAGAVRAEREEFLRVLEAWRTDWESRDSARYLAHYAADFRSDGMDLARWQAHKQRVNAAKAWIRVSLADVSVLRDPGAPARMVVTFEQDYRSSNLAQKSRKRQYWVREEGRWKIAYEGVVGRPTLALPESFPAAGRGS
jgi:murein L,D-transpeptidase YafK